MPSSAGTSHNNTAGGGGGGGGGGALSQGAAGHHANPNAPPIPISITICGDGGCGKSSITLRLVRSAWTSEYDPTIEDSYSVTRRVDGATYHLSLTDTAGQEEYRGMWASSNLGADAFLMVYDITSAASLDALGYFNDLIDMEVETRLDNAGRARSAGYAYSAANEVGANATKTVPPIKFVAGNKCDLSESRQVSAATGLDWARKRGCGFMETSARLEVNIEETFALIVRRVVEARRLAEREGAAQQAGARDGLGGQGGAGGSGQGQAGTAAAAATTGTRRGVTAPLSPLPYGEGEKPGSRAGSKGGRGEGGFWSRLKCW